MSEQLYIYCWGNQKDSVGRFRMELKGRKCRILTRGKLNSCEIEFVDNGERLCCSRNALRKAN